MALSKQQIDRLIQVIGLTQEEEIDCDGCLSQIAEFAERQLAGRSIPDGLVAVEQHLSVCAECREEYEALKVVLKHIGD